MAVAYYNYIRRRNPNLHRERIFRDIDNPLDYLDDTDIICKYRLPRHNIIDLCGRFNRDLRRPTLRSRPLPVSLQVMVALRFYATGSFQAILAKCPGSTHDSFILENTALKDRFERGAIPEGWLLGDSGYPLRLWMLTPVLNPTTRPGERYNASHIRTRNTVERSFGVLKSRFRCLDTSGGSLLFTHEGMQSYGGCCSSAHHVY
ncbi:putative nuclease HARBI1 [Magallana gigas]|uniref:putative nuclease HARBI1 n=1 Tax=Magallana gigas TaxID=29159 RepID=UPI00333F9B13